MAAWGQPFQQLAAGCAGDCACRVLARHEAFRSAEKGTPPGRTAPLLCRGVQLQHRCQGRVQGGPIQVRVVSRGHPAVQQRYVQRGGNGLGPGPAGRAAEEG